MVDSITNNNDSTHSKYEIRREKNCYQDNSHGGGQIKDYKIGVCSVSTTHLAFRNKNKHWLIRMMSTYKLLLQWVSTTMVSFSLVGVNFCRFAKTEMFVEI